MFMKDRIKDETFIFLYNKFKNYVFMICLNKTNSHETSEDYLQNIFIKISQLIEEDKMDITVSRPYIASLTKNYCIDQFRKPVNHQPTVELYEYTTLDNANSSSEELQGEELYETVFTLLDKLPEINSKIFKMRLEGFSYEEIEKHLGINKQSLRVYYMQSKNYLKEKLKSYVSLAN